MFKISLIACGNKMPQWVTAAMAHFQQNLSEYVKFALIEVPLEKRGKSYSSATLMEKEAEKMERQIPQGSYLIALDAKGNTFTTETLSKKLANIQQHASHLCLLIGGPDGIHSSLLEKAQEKWSLSALTLPHPLVRIMITETLYRSFSFLHHHPYHR